LSAVDHRGALEAAERILNRGGGGPEVVRAVLEALHARGVPYAAVRWTGGEEIAVGSGTDVSRAPIVKGRTVVGSRELADGDEAFVHRVATLISPYVSPA
jgi:hypothetical protein